MEGLERVDKLPIFTLELFGEELTTPRAVSGTETAAVKSGDGFGEAGKVEGDVFGDRLGEVLGDVAAEVFAVANKPDVNDEASSGGDSPSFDELIFGNVRALGKDVKVGVPAIGKGIPFDFGEDGSAVLSRFP